MLNRTKISALLLTLSLATSVNVQAEEVSLEQFIGHMLSQSVASVQQELSNNIQGAVTTVTNQFSIYEEETYATKTSINDIDSNVDAKVKLQAE
jgi:hypothetical protein